MKTRSYRIARLIDLVLTVLATLSGTLGGLLLFCYIYYPNLVLIAFKQYSIPLIAGFLVLSVLSATFYIFLPPTSCQQDTSRRIKTVEGDHQG